MVQYPLRVRADMGVEPGFLDVVVRPAVGDLLAGVQLAHDLDGLLHISSRTSAGGHGSPVTCSLSDWRRAQTRGHTAPYRLRTAPPTAVL